MRKRFSVFVVLAVLVLAVSAKSPKNVIFMIGDGMGINQIYAGMVANGNKLNLERCTDVGLIKTYSYSHFTTDSGAGGTALATGVKTRNGMIGMGPDSVAVESILHQAERNGLATGIVSACNVTHATPASYVAHQINRSMYEEIAADYLKTDIDVFIGGGIKNFSVRKDNRNLLTELAAKDYQVVTRLSDLKKVTSGKLAAVLYEDHPPKFSERGDFLPDASVKAIELLSRSKKGFFMMIEGSQIDWAGHDNDTMRIVGEMLDFDKTIGRVLDFAAKDKNTLVIITADHETGGMTLPSGNMAAGTIKAGFSTKSHSGELIPVFAFGPGSDKFRGVYENTAFKKRIAALLKLKE